jgi:hypothetical protein
MGLSPPTVGGYRAQPSLAQGDAVDERAGQKGLGALRDHGIRTRRGCRTDHG